ncbi:MAG TPA: choice-of-anchor tandem repeat GloVer-containing protein [Rhizomicrobium sp.]|jgi:uncharacterized repeat protein (TIGR03803 family)
MRHIRETSGNVFFTAALALGVLAPLSTAHASKEHVLYRFSGSDGGYPEGGVLATDGVGNFYGTTSGGGASGDGAIFKLGSDGSETVLYSFTGGSDGSIPIGGVVRDKAGNLYGTALHGGANNNLCVESTCGTVYRVAPDGTFTVLYTFTGGTDGGNPFAGLILDSKGNLYGTTEQGGSETQNCGPYGCGTVFEVSRKGKETVLYSFHGYQVNDGYNPLGGLTRDDSGNLYGTTFQGGAKSCNCGTVFEVSPEGNETVLHSFNGGDGNGPTLENPVLDKHGNLYGTTDSEGPGGFGTAFRLSSKGKLTILHGFAGGDDGGYVYGGLTLDKEGNFYGTAAGYGANGYGTVYKIASDDTFTVLHAFAGGNDGASPYMSLLSRKGSLYGGTYSGGGSANCTNGCGTVFKVRR